MAGDKIRDTDASLILPGLQRTASRRTDGSGSVEVREANTFRCQLIDPRSFHEVAAVAANILPAHVVDEDEHNVRLFRCGEGKRKALTDGKQCRQERMAKCGHRES